MRSQRFRYLSVTAVFIAALTACGGGTQVAGGGIGGTGISQGSITAFGSVWVNGVEFDTTYSTISKDGTNYHPATLDDLKKLLSLGMVVTVNGTVNSDGVSGTANTVTYTKELLGPIANIANTSAAAATLTVLGQSVIIDNLTKITLTDGSAGTIADLHNGDTVEISGFLSTSGIRATYIEMKTASDTVELHGTVGAINGSIISIGAQDINIDAVPAYTPTRGDFIEVKASVVGSAGAPLQAISIEKKSSGLGGGTHDRAELEGFVTAFTSAAEFRVDGQQVQTNGQTVFSGGAATDIATGVRLEVKGSLSNGILVASRIGFEDQLTLEGKIASIDSTTHVVMLDTYNGVPIEINDVLTEGPAPNSLMIGDYIKIRGRKLDPACTSSCALLATELDLVESGGTGSGGTSGGSGTGTAIESHVTVDSVDATNSRFTTVLGTVVDVSAIPAISGQDSAGNDITTIGAFFAAVRSGDLVDLKGINNNGTVTWTSIELED